MKYWVIITIIFLPQFFGDQELFSQRFDMIPRVPENMEISLVPYRINNSELRTAKDRFRLLRMTLSQERPLFQCNSNQTLNSEFHLTSTTPKINLFYNNKPSDSRQVSIPEFMPDFFLFKIFVGIGILSLLFIIFRLRRVYKSKRNLEKNMVLRTQELARSERRYRTLIESSNDIIFTLDAQGRYTSANQRFYQRFEAKPENVIGQKDIDFLPPATAELMQCKINSSLSGNVETFQWTLQQNGKTSTEMETTLSPLREGKIQITGVVGITRDISQRTQMQHTLKSEHDKLQTILEAMQDMVMILSDELKILYLNRTFKLTFPNIKIGDSCTELVDLLDNYQKKRKVMEKCRTSDPCIWEYWDDKHQLWLNVVACSILLPEGLCQLFILRDVTQTRKLEQERLNAERLAAVTHTAIAYNHEINNPLFGIIGYLEIMMQNEKNDERLEELQLIYEAANRIAEVTRRLRKLTTPAIREYVGSVKMLDLTASPHQGEQ